MLIWRCRGWCHRIDRTWRRITLPHNKCQDFCKRRRCDRSHSKGGGAGSGCYPSARWFYQLLGNTGGEVLADFALHAGGGGRVAIQTNGSLLLGNIDLSGYHLEPFAFQVLPTSSLNFPSGTLSLDTTYGCGTYSGVHGTVFGTRTTAAFNIKPVLLPLTLSIWHPD